MNTGENHATKASYAFSNQDGDKYPNQKKYKFRIAGSEPLAPGRHQVVFDFAYDSGGIRKGQALGDRDKLSNNADGSLDLYIQAESLGGDKDANWLPVAKAPFTLLMRLYSSKAEFLEGAWTPPAVRREVKAQ